MSTNDPNAKHPDEVIKPADAKNYSMGEFTQPKIVGYRQLTEQEALLMNEIKRVGASVGVILDSLEHSKLVDAEWVRIARTTLQTGFMQLTRAVAKPQGF